MFHELHQVPPGKMYKLGVKKNFWKTVKYFCLACKDKWQFIIIEAQIHMIDHIEGPEPEGLNDIINFWEDDRKN